MSFLSIKKLFLNCFSRIEPSETDIHVAVILPKRWTLLFILVASGSSLFGEIEITLNNDFIEQYRDRATISASFVVDKAHPRPNPPKNDGDLHAAGRAPEIGLATVAEIMNAASQKAAVDQIHKAYAFSNKE